MFRHATRMSSSSKKVSLRRRATMMRPSEGKFFKYPKIFIIAIIISSSKVNSNIGDNMRSDESSTSFFQSVDKDGDGILRAAEVANFLEHEIGDTSSFVTSHEISSEANRVIRALDQNHDEEVNQIDILEYWDHMDNLLTAEEVEEWIVHAVQLPEEIGRIFKQNAVTGYDFAELVENNGEILTTELGVTKPSFIKKLVNLMYARMLGIGSVPQPPTDIHLKVENCNSVILTWEKSSAAGFPIHSYRVQRRAVEMFSKTSQDQQNDQSKSNINTSNSNDNNSCPVGKFMIPFRYFDDSCSEVSTQGKVQHQSHLDWVTVYDGADTEFFDSLEPGYSYKYRIQAWNSVGRSTWITADLYDQLKKLKCLQSSSTIKAYVKKLLNLPDVDNSFKRFFFVSEIFMTIVRGIVTSTAVFVAIMKWKRASTDSTMSSSAIKAPFPKLLNNINTMCKNLLGINILPSFMIGIDDDVVPHDVYIKAVGLNGFKKDGLTLVESDTPFDRRVKFSRSESQRNNSCRSLLSSDDSYSLPGIAGLSDSSLTDIKLSEKVKRIESTDRMKPQCGACTDTKLRKENYCQQISSSRFSSRNYNNNDELDDHTICNTCRKKYKVGKRWKHHCARCLSTFCHKHGRTTHSNLTSCKIPGSCVCNKCLEMDKQREILLSPIQTVD